MNTAQMLLLFASLIWAQTYDRSPGYAAYREADSLFVNKKIPEALSSLERALRLDDKLVPALTLYAKIAMTMNRFELARESLDRALAADPNAPYARFLSGLEFYLTNDLQHALPEFLKARQANPRDSRAALYLGLTYESLGQTREAMALYEESVHLEPLSNTYLTGARLLYVMGQLDNCERWVRKALQLEPDSRDAHFELARLLLRMDNPLAAAKEGEHALELSGGSVSDSQIHYLLIRAYRVSQPALAAQHAEALRSLENRKH
jgi:tetratricopeptide (TPR) repeat protein